MYCLISNVLSFIYQSLKLQSVIWFGDVLSLVSILLCCSPFPSSLLLLLHFLCPSLHSSPVLINTVQCPSSHFLQPLCSTALVLSDNLPLFILTTCPSHLGQLFFTFPYKVVLVPNWSFVLLLFNIYATRVYKLVHSLQLSLICCLTICYFFQLFLTSVFPKKKFLEFYFQLCVQTVHLLSFSPCPSVHSYKIW